MSSSYISVLKSLNVQILLIHKIYLNFYRDFVRQFALYDFLLIHYSLYDRFLEADSFDTFFQGDPFLHIPSDGLGFSLEEFFLDNGINKEWILDSLDYFHSDPAFKKKIYSTHIICSGILYGSCKCYIKFINTFLIPLLEENDPFLYDGKDQAYFNYLFVTNSLQKLPFKLYYSQYDGYFSSISMTLMSNGLSIFIDEKYSKIGNLTFQSSSIKPLVIHQYNRCKQLIKMIKSSCG